MDSKKILIGINPGFADLGVCIYVPEEVKPFRKVTKKERIITSSGELTSQIKWISRTLKENRWSLKQVIAIIGTESVDFMKEWSSLKSQVQAFGKFQKENFAHVGRKTTIADVQSEFIRTANRIGEGSKKIMAAKLMAKMLSDRNVPIIECDINETDPSVFTESELNELSATQAKASALVLGKNMNWANNIITERESMWGNRPASYPTFENGGEFIINRNRQ